MSTPDTPAVSRQEDDSLSMMRIQSIQRAGEEDELAMKRMDIQRAGEDDDEMQLKRMDIQRAGEDDDEMQLKRMDIQRAGEEDELAMKRMDIQRAGEEDELAMKRMEIQRAEEDELAMKSEDMRGAFEVGGSVEDNISSAKGSGQAMPDTSRDFFESRMGYDFGGVQIHNGGEADTLNRSLSAKAFTTGSDIFFRQGEYKPDSQDGKQLLAHELTHVVQQGAAGAKAQRKDEKS
ncbi:MAG: DUF4157 domain-containing protein [Burkholderiales bacterium]|nr:DUF4157 domain-containing protein [Anaerolineae bacterium]